MAKKTKYKNPLGVTEEPARRSVFSWLRGRFFAGVVIAAPIAVTFWLLTNLVEFVDKIVRPLLPPALRPETYLSYAIPGFGLLVAIVALTILGAIATNLIGRSIIGVGDRFLLRLPVVRNVYSALKQLVDVVANNNNNQFDEVVMIEFPKKGTWCVGFVSSEARGEIRDKLGGGFIGVFVPTTPNPTSGFLMYVPEGDVRRLDMTVEEGAKMILSAGLVVPESKRVVDGVNEPSLSDAPNID
jgi:uncharacterized membrane protein